MRLVPILDVMRATGDGFGVSVADILSSRRSHQISLPRHVAMYLARRRGYSFPVLGQAFRRDHSTVMYGVGRVGWQITQDESLARAVEAIERRLVETNPDSAVRGVA